MQTRVMRGRRPDADDSGSGRFLTAADRLRELARIAGDLGADEIVHDSIALAERADATAELMDATLGRYAERLTFEIDERRTALMRPRALSGSHAAQLRASIINAQQWLRDLASEPGVSDERLRAEQARFLASVDGSELTDTRNRNAAIGQANEIAARCVREWAEKIAGQLQSLHAVAVEQHAAAVQTLIERIRAAGVPIESDLAVETTFALPAIEPNSVNPPFRWRRPRVMDEAREILRQALEAGSQSVIEAFHEALTLSKRRLEWEIALRLRATADSLKRAADAAQAAQSEGAQGIANELNRIDDLTRRLVKLRP